jgi:hypothetical protein
MVEITGWVRLDEPILGSDDGLQIIDSLGGPDLALSVQKTAGWEKFTMIRAVQEPADLRLTFALTGIGTARVDAVMVRTLQPATPRRLPILAPANSAPGQPPTSAVRLPFVTPQTRQ